MPTLVACLWRRVEAIQLGRVPTHFGPATRLRRPESQWNQGALATSQVEMCPRTANSGLARLLRAGELTPVWVPDTAHEAVRNLVRARAAAVKDVGLKKRQVGAFLLRHSRLFPRKKNWGARYRSRLETHSFEHPADQIVPQEGIESVRLAEGRLARLDRAIGEFLPDLEPRPAGRGAARRRPG